MNELIKIIKAIGSYGLIASKETNNKPQDLEQQLVNLYSASFEIQYTYDDSDYPDFDKNQFPDVIENVQQNFPDFGYYHEVLNPQAIVEVPVYGMGDAIDDLSDIIYDPLEIKWRVENNSEQDAWWYFELIWRGHTKAHVLGLLNYLEATS